MSRFACGLWAGAAAGSARALERITDRVCVSVETVLKIQPLVSSVGAVSAADEDHLACGRRIAVGRLPGDGEDRMTRRRHAGPEDDVEGLVERADRDEDACVVLQPRLVERAVVAPRQAGGV